MSYKVRKISYVGKEAPVIECAGCGQEVHPLDEFPGRLCLGCYERKTEGKTPQELFAEVMEGFGGGKVIR